MGCGKGYEQREYGRVNRLPPGRPAQQDHGGQPRGKARREDGQQWVSDVERHAGQRECHGISDAVYHGAADFLALYGRVKGKAGEQVGACHQDDHADRQVDCQRRRPPPGQRPLHAAQRHTEHAHARQEAAGAGEGEDPHCQLHRVGQWHDEHMFPLTPSDDPAGEQRVAAAHHVQEAHDDIAVCQHEQNLKPIHAADSAEFPGQQEDAGDGRQVGHDVGQDDQCHEFRVPGQGGEVHPGVYGQQLEVSLYAVGDFSSFRHVLSLLSVVSHRSSPSFPWISETRRLRRSISRCSR